MYSTFRSESPQARSSVLFLERTLSGEITPQQSSTRFQTLCAALTEICWPTIARARVKNGSPRGTRKIFGCARMIAPITGSRRASARLALSQYLGFMQRKVQ